MLPKILIQRSINLWPPESARCLDPREREREHECRGDRELDAEAESKPCGRTPCGRASLNWACLGPAGAVESRPCDRSFKAAAAAAFASTSSITEVAVLDAGTE